jgi:hypothetical protein
MVRRLFSEVGAGIAQRTVNSRRSGGEMLNRISTDCIEIGEWLPVGLHDRFAAARHERGLYVTGH